MSNSGTARTITTTTVIPGELPITYIRPGGTILSENSANHQLDKIIVDGLNSGAFGQTTTYQNGDGKNEGQANGSSPVVIHNFESIAGNGAGALTSTNPNEKVVVSNQAVQAEIRKTVTTTVKRYFVDENSAKNTAKSTEIREEQEEEEEPRIVTTAQTAVAPVVQITQQQPMYMAPVRVQEPIQSVVREIGVNKRVIGTEVFPISQRILQTQQVQQVQQAQQIIQPAVQQIQQQQVAYEQIHTDRVLVTNPPVYRTMYVPTVSSCWKRCFGYQPSCCNDGGCCGPNCGCCYPDCAPCCSGPGCNGPCCSGCTLI